MKKRILSGLLAAMMALGGLAVNVNAAYYQQHQSNEATFETMEEVHENAAAWLESEYPGRSYMGDPAMEKYPAGTSYVYRSPGIYNCVSAGVRMNTNLLVYTDEAFADKEAAYAYLEDMGLIDICNEATGSIVLVTPVNPETGFGDADQYAYHVLQSVMCNIGYSVRTEEKTGTAAEAGYFGGLTYRYVIGIGGGATFINDYIATDFDFVSRIAGLLLVGGKMEKIRTIPGCVPVWLVNPEEATIEKYKAGNGTDSFGRNGDDLLYYNSKHPLQKVIVSYTDEVDLKALVEKAYYDLFINNLRIPVVKANLYTASNEFRDYRWNQAPYSLGARNPIIDGVTRDGIHVIEHQEERFSEYQADNGEYITTWYEFLPEEVFSGTADEHSIPLILVNHGGGDDPVQAVDELGFLKLAGEERVAMVAERHSSENLTASFGSASPFDTCSAVLPQLVRYMLDTYPQLDPSRVYVTGYSMGGSATNRAVYGDASVFAAAVNMSGTPYEFTEGQDEQFAEIDIPMMLTTCTYDTYTHFDSANGIIAPDFQMNIKNYLKYNEMDDIEYDFETYPLSGFKGDIYRETMVNDEYPLYQWFFLNGEGAPMVGLSIIEFIPHGLYQEYARIAWNYFKQFSRDPETKEISFNPYAW